MGSDFNHMHVDILTNRAEFIKVSKMFIILSLII
jgi:hypothetical protein